MELDDAIAHAREVAEKLKEKAKLMREGSKNGLFYPKDFEDCETCAAEHEQLAEWLTELQERREADRWIPVSERLPEDRHAVLVYCPENENVYCAFHDDKHWCIFGSYETVWEEVTHWRPLPEYKESEVENDI